MSASTRQASTPTHAPAGKGITYRDLVRALRELSLEKNRPVLVHSSLSSLGWVHGGAEIVVGAMLEMFNTVIAPTFTYKTMIVPEKGPPDNAVVYGAHRDRNKMAEFFGPELPADRLMGIISETLRRHPDALRSGHPILSFCGINARDYLSIQKVTEPLATIAALYDADAWVLLVGVDHRSNTSIHLGERMAGRKMFVRWALMPDMIVTCPNFPSCSEGFNPIAALIDPFTRNVMIGNALVQAIAMRDLIDATRQLLQADPLALLCQRTDCLSCNTIRREVMAARRTKN